MENNKGLTLIEMLIVLLIIAILVGIFYVGYRSTISRERLIKTISLLKIVAEAKREQMVRAPEVSVSGQLINSKNQNKNCPNYDGPTTRGTGYLIACDYLQPENWESDYHEIYVCHQGKGGGCCANDSNAIACVNFDSGDGIWSYYINKAGDCSVSGQGAVPCLEF